jgi:hypothetical protein
MTSATGRQDSSVLKFLGWAEVIVGTAGTVVVIAVTSWLVHGFLRIPSFADSNIAGAILGYVAFIPCPCVIVLIVGIGLLKRKRWARWINMAMFPVLGLSIPVSCTHGVHTHC